MSVYTATPSSRTLNSEGVDFIEKIKKLNPIEFMMGVAYLLNSTTPKAWCDERLRRTLISVLLLGQVIQPAAEAAVLFVQECLERAC